MDIYRFRTSDGKDTFTLEMDGNACTLKCGIHSQSLSRGTAEVMLKLATDEGRLIGTGPAPFNPFKWLWKWFAGTLGWLVYSRQYAVHSMCVRRAQERGYRCTEWRHNILWDTFEYDKSQPPQKQAPFVGWREYVNAMYG